MSHFIVNLGIGGISRYLKKECLSSKKTSKKYLSGCNLSIEDIKNVKKMTYILCIRE